MKRAAAGLALAALLLTGAAAPAGAAGTPGVFDYYVLSLSWSPEYCAGGGERNDPAQCGGPRRYGFVLHGLWPQYAGGGWPASCAPVGPVPPAITARMLPIMPSPALIEHEWAKHGSCSGLDADRYFAAAARGYQSVAVPEPYKKPAGYLSTSLTQLTADFTAANPGLEAGSLSALCRKQYLVELRVCLGKDLKPARCGPDLRNRCGETVVLRPVR